MELTVFVGFRREEASRDAKGKVIPDPVFSLPEGYGVSSQFRAGRGTTTESTVSLITPAKKRIPVGLLYKTRVEEGWDVSFRPNEGFKSHEEDPSRYFSEKKGLTIVLASTGELVTA